MMAGPTLRGINVIKSDLDRLVYLSNTDILGDLPGSEPDLGDLAAVVELDAVEGHSETLLCILWAMYRVGDVQRRAVFCIGMSKY